MMDAFIYGFGIVTGAALFSERAWARWTLAVLAGALAVGSLLDGDWLWALVLTFCAWTWAVTARATQKSF